MKIQIHSKILGIAAAAMIGMAMTGSAALARGGGGFGGGHIGGAETAQTMEDLPIGVSNFSPTQMRMFSADAQLDAAAGIQPL